MKANPLKRFKFIFRDEVDYNYEVIIDIMYLDSKYMLYVID
jgi:hypothetical protein